MNYKKFGIFFGLITLAFIAFTFATRSCGKTDDITDGTNRIAGALTSLEKKSIGGVDQWILIRTINTNNPVLLYLGGGPSLSELAWLRHYNSDLENDFTVVNWDQRGSGKSYEAFQKDTNVNMQTWLSDTVELIDMLRTRFHQDRIFLAGHGFGSLVGIMTAAGHPDKIIAYVGISQMVDPRENDRLLYDGAMKKAVRTGNTNAVSVLRELGSPPYTGTNFAKDYADFTEWLNRLNRDLVYTNDFMTNWMKKVLTATEYSSGDRLHFWRGFFAVFNALYPEMNRIRLQDEITGLRVPVFFISGKYDMTSSPVLTERYFRQLRAPLKKYYLFENSANAPIFEENLKFNKIMKEEVLPLAPSRKRK